MRRLILMTVALSALLLLSACGEKKSETPPAAPSAATAPAAPAATPGSEPPPPGVPVEESFDKDPQLNLFPRIGQNRPEESSREEIGMWNAYIDHVVRSSGMRPKSGVDGSNGWIIKGIKGLDSIGFFAPLAVKPMTTYTVDFDFKGDIPAGGTAGIGVLEFDKFLWIDTQFSAAMLKEHQVGGSPGKELRGKSDWSEQSFTFTTGPRTGMIHLVLYRDGAMDREKVVIFDNIRVREGG